MKTPTFRAAAPRPDSVRRSLQTATAVERPVSQAMQRRFKLSDALGKFGGGKK